MSNKTALLLHHLLPGDAVKLGRLVLNFHYPEHDFCDPENSESPADIITQRLETFNYATEQSNASGFELLLSSLITSASNTKSSTRINVSSTACITRHLRDSTNFFENLCKASGSRRWLESAMKRRDDIFLVTGLKMLTDPSFSRAEMRTRSGNAGVRLPTTLAATAAGGIPIPLDGVLDVGVGGHRSNESTEELSFVAPGEQIFAIQYRRVRFAWFSKKDLDNARLEAGNRWRMYLGSRGTEEDSEAVIEAQLCDCLQEEDFEGEEYDVVTFGEEEYFHPGFSHE